MPSRDPRSHPLHPNPNPTIGDLLFRCMGYSLTRFNKNGHPVMCDFPLVIAALVSGSDNEFNIIRIVHDTNFFAYIFLALSVATDRFHQIIITSVG